MIRNSTNQISIKPKVSFKTKLALSALAILTLIAVTYFSYETGRNAGNDQLGEDASLIEQMKGSIKELQEELDAAQEKNIFAERQQQIQAEAYKQMSNAYAGSEQKNQYLGSRLDFYRSIISPENGQSGPAIQAIEYRQENGSDIEFDVTLIQAIQHKVQVAGSVSAELYLDGKAFKTWPVNSSRNVNYQYFEQVSGIFESVPDHEQAQIIVKLNLNNGTLIERSFDVDFDQANL